MSGLGSVVVEETSTFGLMMTFRVFCKRLNIVLKVSHFIKVFT